MITLYSYPQLFGLPDNNPFGLKVDTFFRLSKIPYKLQHILDTKDAPHGQLPYIMDDKKVISESNSIINYVTKKFNITLDNELTDLQKNLCFLITRMLDNHLYWVMSYSRWQDEHYWPLFKAEFLGQSLTLSEATLEKAKTYNIEKYHYQGIGRYEKNEIYQAGIADLKVITSLLGSNHYLLGDKVHTVDACCYGFLANIFFFEIDTPLKKFILDTIPLQKYIIRIREMLDY